MSEVTRKAQLARIASKELLCSTNLEKNQILKNMARALIGNAAVILKANALDIKRGKAAHMSAALLDRLQLNKKRIKNMAAGLIMLTKLPDPVGRILWSTSRPNGLKIKRVSMPLGVIGIIYESRPNVTADAAGLCIKAGSAIIMRGGSDALNSNKVIVKILRQAIKNTKKSPEIIQFIESVDRKMVSEILTLNKYLDLIIPRGGAGLINKVVQEATVPVIETGTGNCHLYIDKDAQLNKALKIAYNSKVQRPAVCNAVETLLVHKMIADKFLPKIILMYKKAGVIIHGDKETKKYAKSIKIATEKDYATEYLALEIVIKTVGSLTEAVEHINTYGSRHTDAIVSQNKQAIIKFSREVDTAVIISNASTRFTDGGEFGFGCELGISTQKLHARGPLGLPEITAYKYIVTGSGQIRTQS